MYEIRVYPWLICLRTLAGRVYQEPDAALRDVATRIVVTPNAVILIVAIPSAVIPSAVIPSAAIQIVVPVGTPVVLIFVRDARRVARVRS